MTAPMQTTQEIAVDSLSARMKQIVKAYNITTLELNTVPVTVFQNRFHSEGRLIASNRLTMDSHYMVPGHDVQILPSALGLSEPLPAVVVFVAKEKSKEEYKGIQKVNNPKTGNEIFALENGHEWSNGHFVIDGSIPELAKKDMRDLSTDFLKKEGIVFSLDLSTDYKVTYQKGKRYENVCYYKVNNDLVVECKYIDFIINNTRNDQVLTFELVDNTFVTIRSKGVFIASVACCRVNAGDYAPEPHKVPKQSKAGILYARHESAEPVQVAEPVKAESVQAEPVQAVETIEQPENNQPEKGDDMKTMVQKLIEKLAFWFDYFGIKAEAITKSKQEITATDKEWNEAFKLIGWSEWIKSLKDKNGAFDIPCAVNPEVRNIYGDRLLDAPPIDIEPAQVAPALVEHTTRKGKVIRGIIRHDLTKEEAKEIDEYTFAKNGGWFIREKYLTAADRVKPTKNKGPLTRDQVCKKHEKAITCKGFAQIIKEYPTIESALEFWSDIKNHAWPETYGDSPFNSILVDSSYHLSLGNGSEPSCNAINHEKVVELLRFYRGQDAKEKTNTPLELCDDEKNQVPVRTSEPQETEPSGYRNGSTWYGGRYDSTLSTTDICKKIRQHLKEEAAKNPLFVFSKFSVRKDHHRSITVSVLEMGFNPLNPEWIQREKEGKHNHCEPYYTPDGKAFFDRIDELVESYNFDGSDHYSDYFHVNFYKNIHLDYEASKVFRAEIEPDLENRVKEYRQALRNSWPACTQCGEKTEDVYSTEDGQHAGLCWQCFHPYDQAERERRNEQDRLEREETTRQMATVAQVVLEPSGRFIDILLPNLNKNYTLEEYTGQRESGNFEMVRGKITHRATLTAEQYDVLTSHLLENVPWLAGKGGCQCDIDFPGIDSVHQLNPEQMEVYRENVYTLFVEVIAPGRETIYIDPQGYDYARYVGFAASPEVKHALELSGPEENVIPALEFQNSADCHPCVRISETGRDPDQEVVRFEAGKTYSARSIGDHNCIYSITIAKRTDKTVTTTEGKIYRPRVRTNYEGQTVETISAGNYSMAHSWDATDDKVLLRDWEQPAAVEKKKQAEQMDKALLAVENLLAGVPINEVMEQWENENGPLPGPMPIVTPSPAKASTDCAPVNRWNNQAAAGIIGPGAVKVAHVEKPVDSDNGRELWREQWARVEKRPQVPCVEILPPEHANAPDNAFKCGTASLAQRIDAKKDAVSMSLGHGAVPVNGPGGNPSTSEGLADNGKPQPPVRISDHHKKSQPRVRISPEALPEKDEAFYPTPKNLAFDMLMKIKGNPRTILDPSAGKGNLLDAVKDSYNHRSAALYAIEIDSNLRVILQGNGHTVIDSDFLAWSGPDKFDCILMNPPFNRGADHLLKAIDTMYSGQIICLLNAETLRNPYTNIRKDLARRLDELGAEIEYKNRQFIQAERRTPVDVALVNIIIERKIEDDLFQGADDSAESCSETIEDRNEVSTGKRIEELVARYNEVVRLTVETIVNFYRNHNTVGRYIGLNREPSGHWSPQKGYELTAKVQETVNSTVRTIRTDYWRMTIDLPEVKDRMTQKRRSEFEEKLRRNEHMDFTERNIRQFLINLIEGYTKTLEEGVLEVFDRLTIRNSYHEELHTKNIHYFNGWKTNNAYRVGHRVIVPVGGGYDSPFSSWGGKWKLDWTAARSLDDIDLVLSYFNGGMEHVKLSDAIKDAFERGEQSGRSTFFQFKAHKKGTLHLTFLDENILRRFNVAACRGKGWLPGDYGQKPFKDMTQAEKNTVQSFEAGGVEAYNANVGRALFDATINTIQLLEAA